MEKENILDFEDIAKKLEYQETLLDSKSFNSTFKEIKNRIDKIYSSLRKIENFSSITEEKINESIKECSTKVDMILSEIINTNNEYNVSDSNIILINLLDNKKMLNNENVIDRDGTQLKNVKVIGNSIGLYGDKVYESSNIRSVCVIRDKNTKPYYYKEKIIQNKVNCYSKYIMPNRVPKIYEDIHIELFKEQTINSIKIDTTGCDVIKIMYYDSGVIKELDSNTISNFVIRRIYTKKIIIRVASDNIIESEILVDVSRMGVGFNSIIDSIFIDNIKDIDEKVGLIKYKADFKEYKKALEKYNIERKKIAAINKKNGYSDNYSKIIVESDTNGIEIKDGEINISSMISLPTPDSEINSAMIGGI